MPNAVIAHSPDGDLDLDALRAEAARWPGIDGMDLVPAVGATQRYGWDETSWTLDKGYGKRQATRFRVVAVDYGIKRNILSPQRLGCAVRWFRRRPAPRTSWRSNPTGFSCPTDPATRRRRANTPCRRFKRCSRPRRRCSASVSAISSSGSPSADAPSRCRRAITAPPSVKDFTTGKVEIVSMNHGFAVDRASLPANAEETHVSLFDGSNCGIALSDRPAFSVQYHPEASPGPRDSHYLFRRFVDLIAAQEPSLAG